MSTGFIVRRALGAASALALVVATLALLAPQASAQTAERCFPETGYCISGRIREY